jgi:hypothetical protein
VATVVKMKDSGMISAAKAIDGPKFQTLLELLRFMP